jgi:hypothetical protein
MATCIPLAAGPASEHLNDLLLGLVAIASRGGWPGATATHVPTACLRGRRRGSKP